MKAYPCKTRKRHKTCRLQLSLKSLDNRLFSFSFLTILCKYFYTKSDLDFNNYFVVVVVKLFLPLSKKNREQKFVVAFL